MWHKQHNTTRHAQESHYEIFLRILQNKIWFPLGFDAASKDLVSNLTRPTVTQRLTDPDLIRKHPYFTIDWKLVEERKLVPPFKPKLKTPGDTYYFTNKNDDYFPMNQDGLAGESSGAGYDFADFWYLYSGVWLHY